MQNYLEIADKIYDCLLHDAKPKYSTQDIFTLIIKELRKVIKGTSIKFKYSTNISDLYSEDSKYIIYDLSLIPKLNRKDEFILWLATFIETITIDETPQKKEMTNNYDLKNIELYRNELVGRKPIYSTCSAIEDYFKNAKS